MADRKVTQKMSVMKMKKTMIKNNDEVVVMKMEQTEVKMRITMIMKMKIIMKKSCGGDK
jgi:hypothetical protein